MGYRVWLAFDLGIDGNYAAIYEFLDGLAAKECGDGVATFVLPEPDALPALLKKLKRQVHPRMRDRIYVVYQKPNGSPTGKFVHGTRKRAPWTGYASADVEDVADE